MVKFDGESTRASDMENGATPIKKTLISGLWIKILLLGMTFLLLFKTWVSFYFFILKSITLIQTLIFLHHFFNKKHEKQFQKSKETLAQQNLRAGKLVFFSSDVLQVLAVILF